MATREVCGEVANLLAEAETAMREAVNPLRRAADLLRRESILGQDPELLDSLAVVTDANRNAVERMGERLKRVRDAPTS